MPTVAYLSNRFPSPVEPYVADEIRELRKTWVHVIPCSAQPSALDTLGDDLTPFAQETVYLRPLRLPLALRASWYFVVHLLQFADLLKRLLLQGTESPWRRLKALVHTWLGVYYAVLLEGRGVEHIHIHHGYFSSWIGMVAARVLGIGYSFTLHGSDLLVHGAFLDTKLAHCRFAIAISEFNREIVRRRYPSVDPRKLVVQRMGVSIPPANLAHADDDAPKHPLLLSVGRLHRVKDQAFLVKACAELKARGTRTLCLIAGDGPERKSLDRLIRKLKLTEEVGLLGHVPHEQLDAHYAMADIVVLTSRSEGIPLVLMEAMAMGKIVLAPGITGIPELVMHGRTGFLYQPGSLPDFVTKVQMIWDLRSALDPIRRAARKQVLEQFNREKNLAAFAGVFLSRIAEQVQTRSHENPILQQI